MAKPKRTAPESVTATLANGAKISGPAAVVARMTARYGEAEKPKRAPRKAPADD